MRRKLPDECLEFATQTQSGQELSVISTVAHFEGKNVVVQPLMLAPPGCDP
jgi:hypothetical protein